VVEDGNGVRQGKEKTRRRTPFLISHAAFRGDATSCVRGGEYERTPFPCAIDGRRDQALFDLLTSRRDLSVKI
jgi:hypothetical protein